MEIRILTFGKITAITGSDTLVWKDVPDTDSLLLQLNQAFPALQHTKYMLAVNQQVISGNTILEDKITVALLPPFSGG